MIKTILGLLGVDTASGPFTSNLKFTSGGTPSADVNTLDAYVEGTATPNLTLGGGSTGMTYSSRGISYTKIGDVILFSLSIILTAKGSSTGALVITGLPVSASATSNFPCSIVMTNLGATVGDTFLSAWVSFGSSSISIFQQSGGSRVQLTDADITDTTNIRITGLYKI
jgi:hypothetical protein